MLKILAICAVGLLIPQAPLPVPRQVPQVSASTGSEVKKQSGHDKSNPEATFTSSNDTAPNQKAAVKITELPKVAVSVDRDYFDRSYWIFSGLLVVVGGLQVWFLWGTLVAITTQVNDARNESSANALTTKATLAALQEQVRIMIDSERPWIIAHMEQSERSCLLDNGNARFTWTVKNVGKSPAKLIEAGARVTLDTLGPPLYPVQYKMESLNERILVPGDSIPLFILWSIIENGQTRTRVGKTMEEFNDFAMIYGCARYRGATGTSDIYETRFSESSVITSGVCEKFEPHWPVNPEDIRCT